MSQVVDRSRVANRFLKFCPTHEGKEQRKNRYFSHKLRIYSHNFFICGHIVLIPSLILIELNHGRDQYNVSRNEKKCGNKSLIHGHYNYYLFILFSLSLSCVCLSRKVEISVISIKCQQVEIRFEISKIKLFHAITAMVPQCFVCVESSVTLT